jgi:2,4-didehydro-3-deoxy-L-rhamnonate hydrolase
LRLVRFGPPGRERPGVQDASGIRDVSAFGEDFGEDFFGTGGIERLRRWLGEAARAPRVERVERQGPPIRRPSKILCIGLNYADHAEETKARLPKEPVLFLKATSALCGPFDELVMPRHGSKLDWEVELAVVIGQAARYVDAERALEHVAGFAVHVDYSERAFQLERGGQWTKGKSCDTFAPLGPCLTTLDEAGGFQALDLSLSVNGVERQSSNTSRMLFDVPYLVSYLSQFMTLLPGDVISTGTPAGVGLARDPPVWLAPGDVVESRIEGLGSMRQVVAAPR